MTKLFVVCAVLAYASPSWAAGSMFDCATPPGREEHAVPALPFMVARCPVMPSQVPHAGSKGGVLRVRPGLAWQAVADGLQSPPTTEANQTLTLMVGPESHSRLTLDFASDGLWSFGIGVDAAGAQALEGLWGKPVVLPGAKPNKLWFNRAAGIKATLHDISQRKRLVEQNGGQPFVLVLARYVPLRDRFASGVFGKLVGKSLDDVRSALKGVAEVREQRVHQAETELGGETTRRVELVFYVEMLGAELDNGGLSVELTLSESGVVTKATLRTQHSDPDTLFAVLAEIDAGTPGSGKVVQEGATVTVTFDLSAGLRLTLRSETTTFSDGDGNDVGEGAAWVGELVAR